MKKIDGRSADLVAENVEKLKSLFPELITEGPEGLSVNVDVLKQLVGDQTVTDCAEKYGLNWFGKRRARQLALTPSTGTLRPAPEESEDWDTTQNLFIEGDNLEVLKLLQKSYAGRVKLIYIDPPYNTGKDFVYKDDFRDNIRNYKKLTGQVDEEGSPLTTNTESSGRFHTDWLNMMYPRIKLAYYLLQKDGLVFVSIDTTEVANLRMIMDEIFGPENLIGVLPTIMNLKGNNDAFAFSDTHEFTIVYAKNKNDCVVYKLPIPDEELDDWNEDERGLFKRADTLRRTGQDAARERRPKGWFPIFITQSGQIYVTEDDRPKHENDIELWPINDKGEELSWTWSKTKIMEESYNLMVVDGRNGKTIYKKQRPSLGDLPSSKPKSILYKPSYSSSNGTAEIKELFGEKVFESPPKPLSLIKDFIAISTDSSDYVIDFFAGSGTTGHAVMAQNAKDGGNRRYILVQLPEPLDPEKKEQKTAAEYCDKLGKPRTIAELTKERLRRAARKIKEEISREAAKNAKDSNEEILRAFAPSREPNKLDTGFRVFKLDSSNIKAWNPRTDDLEADLADQMEHILPDRTEADLLYELLLKLGLDLCVPIETRYMAREVAKNAKNYNEETFRAFAASRESDSDLVIHAIGGGVLMACLAEKITTEETEALGLGIVEWHKELAPAGDTTCVFRDSAFENDVAKTNLAAILEQAGIANVRSL